MGFIFQIFIRPAIALAPALFIVIVIVIVYGGKFKLPLALPGGFVAVLLGIALAWTLAPSVIPISNCRRSHTNSPSTFPR